MPKLFATLFLIFLSSVLFGFLPAAVLASTSNGTISGYAWSSQIGWVNFGTTNGNTHIIDTAVSGYAWNENMGWINLNPTGGGVKNDGSGNLSGRAWLEGTGWINFSGVKVSSSGLFTGIATGDNNVNVSFDCTTLCHVTTDWRPASQRNAPPAPSVSSGGGYPVSPVLQGNFSVTVNDGSGYTNNPVVALTIDANSEANVTRMAVSNFPDLHDAVQESYIKQKLWTLLPGDGKKTVYVKLYNQTGQVSNPFVAYVVLDTVPPQVQITSIKNSYNQDEEVIIRGTSEPDSQITLHVDATYGSFTTDNQGNWFVTIGKLPVGNHHIELTPKDLAGNIGNTATADFSVTQSKQTQPPPFALAPPLAPILKQFAEGIQSLLPQFFQPITKQAPTAVVLVPQKTPIALAGKINYLSTSVLSKFVLAPLPADVKLLAQKFPQVEKTFNAVGVQKITDVQKLTQANLKLPNLTEAAFPQVSLSAGNFSIPKGIPIAKLSAVAKSRIPSEIVFAKAAGGLVDFNVALSINAQGKTEQTIETVSGHPLQLVVKADKPVRKVIGYIVFKSKKYNQTASGISLNHMTASLLFAAPDLAGAVAQNTSVPLEGAKVPITGPSIHVNSPTVPVTGISQTATSSSVEQRLVLSTFEYTDSGDGLYTATVQAPVVDGEYEVITEMDYVDTAIPAKEIRLTTVVDPEGYVYEKNGDLETRIAGAIVSLYWLNPDTKAYELWPAANFQQENPQTTDVRGTYSFLVPDGYYYLKVDAPGYLSYDGKPFEVTEGSGVHINIEMRTQYWFLNLIDWKTLLLIIVVLMLLYNFYKDKMRDRTTKAPVNNQPNNQ